MDWNDPDPGYENTYPAERYAWGCACTYCRTEGARYVEGDTCTVTRSADSFA